MTDLSFARLWHRWRFVILVAAALAAALAIGRRGLRLDGETGLIELATVMLFALGAALAARKLWHDGTLAARWELPTLLAIFAFREMDAHDWFYEPGLLHAAVISGPAPLWQKLVTGSAILFIVLVLGRVTWRGARPFVAGLLRGRGWAWTLATGGAFAACATLLDGAEGRLAALSIALSPTAFERLGLLEEVLEMLFAASLLLCLWSWRRTAQVRGSQNFPM